jgi:regulator of protease activity HflC (stomatin/prohibitin superfamily)
MFDLIVQTILEFLHLFKFFGVLDPYQAGVKLRLGKFVTVLENGFYWQWPFGIEQVLTEHIVPTTHSLGEESITSKDGKSITFHAIVTYKVNDVRKALLEIQDVDHAVRDACSGECGRVLHESTWDEIIDVAILDTLTAACRKRGWRYGIEIMSVQLAGLAIARNFRLFNRGNS